MPFSGQYVSIYSPTTFHVFLDQYLWKLYIEVWASGGICLLRCLNSGFLTLETFCSNSFEIMFTLIQFLCNLFSTHVFSAGINYYSQKFLICALRRSQSS